MTDNKILVEDILRVLKRPAKVVGSVDGKYCTEIKSVGDAHKHALVFIGQERKDKQALATNTQAEIILCDEFEMTSELAGKCFIVTDNPRLSFLDVCAGFFAQPAKTGIAPSAVIHPEASIHPESYVGPNASIGKAIIREGVAIHGNCFIYDNVTIEKGSVINAGAIIGFDGFGHIRNEQGVLVNFPHIGGVVIEENVEIGANTCVASGTLFPTVIKKDTKIDALCQVGHNVVIGESSLILSRSVIGGSTRLGKNVTVAIGAVIADQLRIGDECHIGPNVLVLNNLEERSKIVARPGVVLPG